MGLSVGGSHIKNWAWVGDSEGELGNLIAYNSSSFPIYYFV